MPDIETFVQKAKEKGYSDDDIYAYLVEKGLVKEDPIANVKEMEMRIKKDLEKKYDQKLKDEIFQVKEELSKEAKERIKKVIKTILLKDETD